MSYARFGWEGSSVYVFLSVGGALECCACALGDDGRHFSTEAMLAHLQKHREAGHTVPQDCIDRLKEEAEENDTFIEAGGRESA